MKQMPVEDPKPLIGTIKFIIRHDLEQLCLLIDGYG